MYTVGVHKRVDKFLEKHRDLAKRFVAMLPDLEADPCNNSLDIKSLIGKEGQHYRLRVGKYRFLYEVIEDRVLIYFYDAGSRGDIY